MYKLRLLNFPDRVPQLAIAKSYRFPIRVKLGSGRANFEITLVERPSKKSCSTSFLKENPLELKISTKNIRANFEITLVERPFHNLLKIEYIIVQSTCHSKIVITTFCSKILWFMIVNFKIPLSDGFFCLKSYNPLINKREPRANHALFQ